MTDTPNNPTPAPARLNSGGLQFLGSDGEPTKGAGTNKGLPQLLAEKAARENKPLDQVQAEMDKPKQAIVLETRQDVAAPLKAADFDIGRNSKFAMNLPDAAFEGDWDAAEETQVRTWLESAGANAGNAAALTMAMGEIARADEAAFAAFEGKSLSWVHNEYGDRKGEALSAAKRVIEEIGGENLKAYLNKTGLGNHPQVVKEFFKLAERKEYYKK